MLKAYSDLHRPLVILLAFLLAFPISITATDERAEERAAMVIEQIKARGIKDSTTLAALRSVPRHLFLPAAQRPYAYQDRPLPIGYGQTISQPFMVAYMTELINPGPGRKVLEIGTGSGYQAAILAAAGAEVFSIEIIPQLAEAADKRLAALGYGGVSVRAADGFYGWAEQAPFDAIIVTAAAEFIPPPLLEQLAEGGRIVIPVGSPYYVQTLMLVQKREGKPYSTSLMPVRFVPFTRTSE
jgi:protein-L-isoaspartate(D-aspartate) O-methyltransferase